MSVSMLLPCLDSSVCHSLARHSLYHSYSRSDCYSPSPYSYSDSQRQKRRERSNKEGGTTTIQYIQSTFVHRQTMHQATHSYRHPPFHCSPLFHDRHPPTRNSSFNPHTSLNDISTSPPKFCHPHSCACKFWQIDCFCCVELRWYVYGWLLRFVV